MTGSLDHRRLAPLAAALPLAALALGVLFAPGISIAAGTPGGWSGGKSTIERSSHSAAPTWPAHPRAIRLTGAAAPPTWPTHPRAIRPAASSATAATPERFDWGAAGIGAGVGALLTVICGAAALIPTTRRARRARAA